MRIRSLWQAIAVVGLLGVIGCSKHTTAPVVVQPPAVVSSTYQYQLGPFSTADSSYAVKSLEYADANGVVRTVNFQDPLWRLTLDLKPGDRIYVRAVVDFRSMLFGGIQVTREPSGFYASARSERQDGPATAVLTVDQILK